VLLTSGPAPYIYIYIYIYIYDHVTEKFYLNYDFINSNSHCLFILAKCSTGFSDNLSLRHNCGQVVLLSFSFLPRGREDAPAICRWRNNISSLRAVFRGDHNANLIYS